MRTTEKLVLKIAFVDFFLIILFISNENGAFYRGEVIKTIVFLRSKPTQTKQQSDPIFNKPSEKKIEKFS